MAKKLHYSQEQCIRAAGKLMQNTGMLKPHARVGIAVSGGVDSFVLLKVMQIRQRITPFPFEIMAIHINAGFDPNCHAPLVAWLEEENIPYHVEVTNHGLLAHTEENRTKSPCYYCAFQRRKRLFELCKEHNLSHLAFGHNADDIVSTFLLNLVQTGRIDGMSMYEPFFGGLLTVIRPLAMVEKQHILKAAKLWELPIFSNPCPSAGTTKRTDLLSKLDVLCEESQSGRRNVYQGIIRWQLQKHLLAPEDQVDLTPFILAKQEESQRRKEARLQEQQEQTAENMPKI